MAFRFLLGIQPAGNVVPDPFGIYPFQGGDFHTTDKDAEMQMVAERQAGTARFGDDGAFLDHIAHLDVDLAQVGIKGHEAQTVIDDDEVAVDAKLACEDHAAIVGCGNFGVADRGQVKPQMIGLAHLLALIGEVAVVAKTGTGRGAGQALEGPF